MARSSSRSVDWGFPRWRAYGEASTEAATIRLCDRHGCTQKGDCPAPKSPNSPERWYFCQEHAGEYNRGWNYFEGLSAEEAAERERAETQTAEGYTESRHHQWAGPGDGSRSRDEIRALEVLELEVDADFETVRVAWRRLAKSNHPDVRPGDKEAAARFLAIQAAYDVLKAAEDQRTWEARGLKTVHSDWANTVLVCKKCSKKLDGGFGPKGKTPLAKALREELGVRKGRKGTLGILEVKCLGICPRGAVTVVTGDAPGDWALVKDGAPMADVVRDLGLRASAPLLGPEL